MSAVDIALLSFLWSTIPASKRNWLPSSLHMAYIFWAMTIAANSAVFPSENSTSYVRVPSMGLALARPTTLPSAIRLHPSPLHSSYSDRLGVQDQLLRRIGPMCRQRSRHFLRPLGPACRQHRRRIDHRLASEISFTDSVNFSQAVFDFVPVI